MYVDVTAGSVSCNEDDDPEMKMSSLFHELAETFVTEGEEFEEDDKSFIKAVAGHTKRVMDDVKALASDSDVGLTVADIEESDHDLRPFYARLAQAENLCSSSEAEK